MKVRIIWIVLLAAGFAVAQNRPLAPNSPVRARNFNDLDTNRNGQIDRNEWPGWAALFAGLDRNHDGALNAREYFLRGDDWDAAERFHAWDRNNNGQIEPGEWQSYLGLFKQVDQNEDNRVSFDEFLAADQSKRFRDYDRNDDGSIQASEWDSGRGSFEQMDQDGDGRISPYEYFMRSTVQEREAKFERWDRNGDGQIEGPEWHAPSELFAALDSDRNSTLSRQEFLYPYMNPSRTQARFRDFDHNKDGVIGRREWQRSGSEFQSLDRNGDGVITAEEFAARSNDASGNASFDALDRNRDGVLAMWEWNGNRSEFVRLDKDGNRVVSRSELGFGGQSMSDERFRALDRNRDGAIARWEWDGDARSFLVLDRDRDGLLSRNEVSPVQ